MVAIRQRACQLWAAPVQRVIAIELPAKVADDLTYQNAMSNSDWQKRPGGALPGLGRAVTDLPADHTELLKQFSANESFRKWLSEMVFAETYVGAATAAGIRLG